MFAKSSFEVLLFVGILDFSLRDMDQKFEFGGLIGYGNSCLDSVFRYSKVFRLHAILHDAAGAVRSHSGKGPGYRFMIGEEQIHVCLVT